MKHLAVVIFHNLAFVFSVLIFCLFFHITTCTWIMALQEQCRAEEQGPVLAGVTLLLSTGG